MIGWGEVYSLNLELQIYLMDIRERTPEFVFESMCICVCAFCV